MLAKLGHSAPLESKFSRLSAYHAAGCITPVLLQLQRIPCTYLNDVAEWAPQFCKVQNRIV